jgi:hypothetical protein
VRHARQSTREPDVPCRNRGRDPKPAREPRRERDERVADVHASTVELADASGALRLDRTRGPLELFEVLDQTDVRRSLDVVRCELLDRGSKVSHAGDRTESPFEDP